MSAPKRITRAWLVRRKACADQFAIFNAKWPDGVDLTRANLLRAAQLQLDLGWLAEQLLDPTALRVYDEAIAPARRAFNEATDSARWAFNEATDSARRAFNEATASAWRASARRAYHDATASALRAYEEATAPAWRAFEEVRATALADALGLPQEVTA